ncbi:hypothetical protein CJ197_14385 [Brachybacterium sp. UMB0905]|nr:hypothetical protein CJ197_14385 [Brachybacterium sp. UMB0905]
MCIAVRVTPGAVIVEQGVVLPANSSEAGSFRLVQTSGSVRIALTLLQRSGWTELGDFLSIIDERYDSKDLKLVRGLSGCGVLEIHESDCAPNRRSAPHAKSFRAPSARSGGALMDQRPFMFASAQQGTIASAAELKDRVFSVWGRFVVVPIRNLLEETTLRTLRPRSVLEKDDTRSGRDTAQTSGECPSRCSEYTHFDNAAQALNPQETGAAFTNAGRIGEDLPADSRFRSDTAASIAHPIGIPIARRDKTEEPFRYKYNSDLSGLVVEYCGAIWDFHEELVYFIGENRNGIAQVLKLDDVGVVVHNHSLSLISLQSMEFIFARESTVRRASEGWARIAQAVSDCCSAGNALSVPASSVSIRSMVDRCRSDSTYASFTRGGLEPLVFLKPNRVNGWLLQQPEWAVGDIERTGADASDDLGLLYRVNGADCPNAHQDDESTVSSGRLRLRAGSSSIGVTAGKVPRLWHSEGGGSVGSSKALEASVERGFLSRQSLSMQRMRFAPSGWERNFGWHQHSIYCKPDEVGALLLTVESAIANVGREQRRRCEVFFVRYTDSHGFHVRLRWRLEDGAESATSVESAILSELKGVWSVRTGEFDPEIVRYGGRGPFLSIEKIFCAETELFIADVAAASAGSSDSPGTVPLCELFRSSTQAFVDAFCAVFSEPERWRASWLEALHSRALRMRTDMDLSATTGHLKVMRLSSSRMHDVSAAYGMAGNAVGKAARECTLTAPPIAILGSLLHMAFNRFVGISPKAESLVTSFAFSHVT